MRQGDRLAQGDDAQFAEIELVIAEQRGNMAAVGRKLGVNKITVWRWVKRYERLRRAVDAAVEAAQPVDLARLLNRLPSQYKLTLSDSGLGTWVARVKSPTRDQWAVQPTPSGALLSALQSLHT
jgi:predicted alpha/beta-fold hydrolase